MKCFISGLFFISILILPGCSKSNNISSPMVADTSKKGICLTESVGFGSPQVNALALGWYYDYGLTTNFQSSQEFIPMAFSLKSIPTITPAKIIMGFNEPDNANQSNISVGDALNNWPVIVKNATRVGSPATAGNPLNANSWLSNFMLQKPKIDFITIHWYKGVDANKFIADVTAIIAEYNLPVWVTEFAPQTAAESNSSPTKYSQEQVSAFITTTLTWMNKQPMVERYAWHDSKIGTSAIFTPQGDLTITGQQYRDAK